MKTVHSTLRKALFCSALCLNASLATVTPVAAASSAPVATKMTGFSAPVLHTVSTASITPTLNSLASSMNGTRWNERNGLGKQCYSFAHYVFNTIFNRGNRVVGSYQGSTQHKFSSIASDISCLGTLNPGEGQGNMASLLGKAAPGDYIQLKRRSSGGPHSAILLGWDGNTIRFLDANSDNCNTIKSQTMTLSAFWNQNQGMSIYRYKDYSPSSNNSGNTASAENYIVTTNNYPLTVRTGPGTGYAAIGSLPKGSTVAVYSISNGWAQVNINGQTGYASMTYLSKASSSETTKKVTARSGLNMRSQPSTSGSIIVAIPYGTTVTVSQESNDWGYVTYNGRSGWASMTYLQ